MSVELEQEVKDLKDAVEVLVKLQTAPLKPELPVIKTETLPTLSWTKYIGQIITVVVLGVGIVGSWYTTQAAVDQNSIAIAKQEQKFEKQEQKLEKHQSELENVKLQAVVGSQDVKHIKEKVDKMDEKIDKLLAGQ